MVNLPLKEIFCGNLSEAILSANTDVTATSVSANNEITAFTFLRKIHLYMKFVSHRIYFGFYREEKL